MYYTQTPNEIYAVMDDMSNSELRVTLALVRETYGYHKPACNMTYGDFAAYGLTSPDSIRRGIVEVLDRGFFKKGNGRSEFVIAEKTTENVELDDEEATENVVLEPENTTGNVETTINEVYGTTENVVFDGVENYGKRSVPLYKDKTPTVLKKKKRGRGSDPPPHPTWEMPDGLNVAEFESAWISWYMHLEEKNRPLTYTSGEMILDALAEMGSVRATAAIKHSIKRGWLSIHEPQTDAPPRSENGTGKTRDEIIAEAVASAGGW